MLTLAGVEKVEERRVDYCCEARMEDLIEGQLHGLPCHWERWS